MWTYPDLHKSQVFALMSSVCLFLTSRIVRGQTPESLLLHNVTFCRHHYAKWHKAALCPVPQFSGKEPSVRIRALCKDNQPHVKNNLCFYILEGGAAVLPLTQSHLYIQCANDEIKLWVILKEVRCQKHSTQHRNVFFDSPSYVVI